MAKGKGSRKGASQRPVYALTPASTRKSARVSAETKGILAKERAKEEERRLMSTAHATLQKQLDVAAAEERAVSSIMERRSAEAELKKLLPRPSKSIATTTRRLVKIKENNSIERALEEEAKEEAEKEVKREERKRRVAEEKRLFEEGQKAKKTRKNWMALEKKYGLNHRSFEKIKDAAYEEELAKGHNEGLAKAVAHLHAIGQAEPYMRLLKDGKLLWSDILNMENEEDAKRPKPKKAGIRPLSPNASVVAVGSFAPTIFKPKATANSRTLLMTGLPSETSKGQLDWRKMNSSIYGVMTGMEIFGPVKPKMLQEVIIRPKLSGAFQMTKIINLYKVLGTGNKLGAYIIYPTEALAKQALAYAKKHPIRIKGVLVNVQPA